MLTINDIISVLSDMQAAEVIDAPQFVQLLTAFNQAVQTAQERAAVAIPSHTLVRPGAAKPDPSDSALSASDEVPVFNPQSVPSPASSRRRVGDIEAFEVIPYPPSDTKDEDLPMGREILD